MTATEFDPQRFSRSLYELVVLATLSDGAMHGYQIGLEVADRSNGLFVLQHGTLYPVLHRLEEAGLIRGRWSHPKGERKRKVYEMTAAGRRHLAGEGSWAQKVFEGFLEALHGDDGVRAAAGAG